MRRTLLLATLLAAAAAFSLAPGASAHVDDIYSFFCPSGVGEGSSSCPNCEELNMTFSEMRYHVAPQFFTWTSHYEPDAQNRIPDALWVVVDEGPDPQNVTDEFAILYADLNTGRVTAYVYDKDASQFSWQTGAFIASFPNGVTVNQVGNVTQVTLFIDATPINAFLNDPSWKGVSFGQTIGFWAAALCNAQFTYDDKSGEILDFSSPTGNLNDCKCSYDRNDRTSGAPVSVDANTWGQVKGRYHE